MTEQRDFREFNKQLITRFRESGGVGELGPVTFTNLVVLTHGRSPLGQPARRSAGRGTHR